MQKIFSAGTPRAVFEKKRASKIKKIRNISPFLEKSEDLMAIQMSVLDEKLTNYSSGTLRITPRAARH